MPDQAAGAEVAKDREAKPVTIVAGPLTPPPARLTRLNLTTRVGPLLARAFLLVQGSLRERVWYAAALPAPPARLRSLLDRALGGSAAGPLGRALRLQAAQIPLRIDVGNRHGWSTVLRTVVLRRTRVGSGTLQPPRGYRKAMLLGSAGQKLHPRATPAAPVRCGLLLVTGVLGCTSAGADLTGLAGRRVALKWTSGLPRLARRVEERMKLHASPRYSPTATSEPARRADSHRRPKNWSGSIARADASCRPWEPVVAGPSEGSSRLGA